MANTERRSRTRRGIFIAIAIVLIVYLIGSTYARYSTTGAGTGTIAIAEWHVVITADDGTTLTSTTQPITFKVQSNSNVVSGKIAPAVTAVAEVELDLTGTEVAVDFSATVGDLSSYSGLPSSDKITLTVNGNDSETIALDGDTAFTAANGKRTVTLTMTWENDDTNNADDTSTGTTGGTFTIPVTLTAQQHIG